MRQLVTQGVAITIESEFRGTSGRRQQYKYIFDYHVTIENNNDYDIQVVNRYWFIFGSNLKVSEINGEGIVGQRPKIKSSKEFVYSSCSFLTSEMGYMEGYYGILNLDDNSTFEADIPRVELIADWKLN